MRESAPRAEVPTLGILGTFLDVGTTAKIGNGGRVRVPEGQTSVFYDVEKTVLASEKRKARRRA